MGTSAIAMATFILHLDDPTATDPERVGPKAANLARLMQVGLPTPGGFALTADAYRHQLHHLGIEDLLRQYSEADLLASRRISIQIRLALYERPIAPEILRTTAHRVANAARDRSAGCSSLIGADRRPQGRQFRGAV